MAASFFVTAGTLSAALVCYAHFLGWPRQPNLAPSRGRQRLGVQMDVSRQGGVCVTGLDKTRAEELLDRLEICGVRDGRVTYVPGQGFSVCYGGVRPAAGRTA